MSRRLMIWLWRLRVSGPQFSLLAAVRHGESESLTISELADVMGMNRSTLGHNLRPLARSGWISIETGRDDARRRRIRLTTEGCAKLKEAGSLWARMQARFDSVLQKSDRKPARRIVCAGNDQILSERSHEIRKHLCPLTRKD